MSISVCIEDDITIIIKDNGKIRPFKELEQEVISSMVYARVYSYGGDLSFSMSGESSIEITLPLVEKPDPLKARNTSTLIN